MKPVINSKLKLSGHICNSWVERPHMIHNPQDTIKKRKMGERWGRYYVVRTAFQSVGLQYGDKNSPKEQLYGSPHRWQSHSRPQTRLRACPGWWGFRFHRLRGHCLFQLRQWGPACRSRPFFKKKPEVQNFRNIIMTGPRQEKYERLLLKILKIPIQKCITSLCCN